MNWPTTNVASGSYKLEFHYSVVNFQAGDATGANVGFGIRDTTLNDDIFATRVQKQNNEYRLQTRINGVNVTLANFGTTVGKSLKDLRVRVEFNLDTDTANIVWSLGGGSESKARNIAINNFKMDALRVSANTNTDDLGRGDLTLVDYVSLSTNPEPSPVALLGIGGFTLALRQHR